MTLYSVSSDQHCHSWSQFSQADADGVNSRLRVILNELERQADILLATGGTRMFLGGDLFHVRGKIEPEVLNPTMEAFKRICAKGVEVFAIAGNHDLSGRHSDKLGNAMQSLDEIHGFTAVTAPQLFDDVMMVPWVENLDELRAEVKKHAAPDRDLIIHAPVNGVIKGLPDHGLEPVELASLGFRRVFVGHYHNHKIFPGEVYSIGATTHQTWSDPDTAAGFLMVDDTTVQHYDTAAPKFVNVDDGNFVADYVFGNFCRLRLKDAEEQVIKDLRAGLEAAGAVGIVDHSSKKREIRRGAAPANGAAVTLEVSVATFVIKTMDTKLDRKRLGRGALEILSEARMAGND